MPQTKRTPLVRVARHSFRNLNEGIELTQLVTKNIEFLPSGEGLWNYVIWRFNGAIMTITDNPVSTNGAVGSIILGNFPAATVLVECASARLTVTRGDTNITATAAMSIAIGSGAPATDNGTLVGTGEATYSPVIAATLAAGTVSLTSETDPFTTFPPVWRQYAGTKGDIRLNVAMVDASTSASPSSLIFTGDVGIRWRNLGNFSS